MGNKLNYLLYGISYWIKTQIFKYNIPFIGGLVINEKCNLSCSHCQVSNRGIPDLTYEEVRKGLQDFYDKGIRSLAITGGEPYLWSDGEHRIDDVIYLSREIGFKVVSLYTNGTFTLNSNADVLFVSIDGLKETSVKLRGDIYDRVLDNIKNSTHNNIIVNATINKLNEHELERFCEFIASIPKVNGIFFYFHTPYYGIDGLFLTIEERRSIIKRIYKLKKDGFKIFNSKACLKSVYKDNWERPSKVCYVYANNKIFQCCRAIGNEIACKNCGYMGYTEIINILKLKPSAILSALNYLPRNKEKEELSQNYDKTSYKVD